MAKKADARTFGQDLMKGEHVVGAKAPTMAFGSGDVPRDESRDSGQIAAQEYEGGNAISGTGTSIFDPVLCELAYRWFSPADGLVLDPFAGGSVRGIVAAKLGRDYVGCELRPEQVAANREQADRVCAGGVMPRWVEGDSAVTIPGLDVEADFIFSCPPYGDLEVYSERADDLSTMGHEAFVAAYRVIIAAAVGRLKQDRFACFVIGDFRDRDGFYRNFVSDTIAAFQDAGARLYNEMILVTAVGSLPIRTGKQFAATRKAGKTHQNVLVFCKGDPKRASIACGEVEFGDIPELDGADLAAELEPVVCVSEGDEANTPIHRVGDILLKRDDLFEVAGVRGGKVRSCWTLSQGAAGLITAGSRASPQVNIVAHIAQTLGIPCRVHVPSGPLAPEVAAARDAGAEIVQHRPGYNSVIVARAREDAVASGWREIPFGMECEQAVQATASQVAGLPWGSFDRIVVPVGSGMSLAGVLHGLVALGIDIPPVLGVVVGADPVKRLDTYAPAGWRSIVELQPAGIDYHHEAPVRMLGAVALDPIYEAKCLPFMKPRDLLWVVGIRKTAA